MRKDVLKLAIDTIKAKRIAELKKADDTQEKAFSIPEINETYEELKTLELDQIKAEAFGIQSNLEKEINAAKADYLTALKQNGYTESDFDVKYDCPKCNDTGMINGELCDCVKKLYEKLLAKSSAISELAKFKVSDFVVKSETDENHLQFVKTFIDKFPPHKTLNLILRGRAGSGKTFMASCIANGVLEKGYGVLFYSAFEIVQRCLKYHTSNLVERDGMLDDFLESDLLIIDDLGTETKLQNVTAEYLLLIISERISHKKHTIVTTNLNHNQIVERYGERFFSRLFAKSYAVEKEIEGDDKRLKN